MAHAPARIETPKTGALLMQTLAACRGALFGVALFSALINVLMLAGAFYMLQVYDRVLTSSSVPTLIALSVLVAGLYAIQGALDFVRTRLMNRVASFIALRLGADLFRLGIGAPGTANPLRDNDTVKSFVGGPGPKALFDLPWIPVYLAVIYLFHPVLGMLAAGGAAVLVVLALIAEQLTRKPSLAGSEAARTGDTLNAVARRSAEALIAMGMGRHLAARWQTVYETQLQGQQRANDVSGGMSAVTRALRMLMQSAILGAGAYLVIAGQASAGIIIAGSIVFGRAMAPIDQVIANWKGLVLARAGWSRLKILLAAGGAVDKVQLPDPHLSMKLETVSVAPPGGMRQILTDVDFALAAGDGLGVLGASAAGKSSLMRVLTGVWPPEAGRVQLDGAELGQWGEALGRHIGYLPQNVELLTGTIAENIGRFDPDASDADLVAAARAAGVHEMIVDLPEGYNTVIGEQAAELSAGQRQRVGLARALCGEPFLIVLDEPNAHLDTEGEAALNGAIAAARARGAIVIVATHRTSTLAHLNKLAFLAKGGVAAFGERDAVLKRLNPGAEAVPTARKREAAE